MELINREKLILDMMDRGVDHIQTDDLSEINQIIAEQEVVNRWIPVGERLPNRDEYIKNNGLFNVSDGNRSYSEWFDIYDKQRFGEPTISGFRVDHAVIAWMPLPERYEPQESEQP